MDNKQKIIDILESKSRLTHSQYAINERAIYSSILFEDIADEIDALYDLTCYNCQYNEGGGCNQVICYRSGHTYPDLYKEADK